MLRRLSSTLPDGPGWPPKEGLGRRETLAAWREEFLISKARKEGSRRDLSDLVSCSDFFQLCSPGSEKWPLWLVLRSVESGRNSSIAT